MVPKANCGLAVFPAGVLPPTGSRAPDAHHVSKKTGFLLPQSTQCLDGNMRSTQFQTTKPSGLRMPSPSLEFFWSASNSSSQKATQPMNTLDSFIPSLQKLNASNKSRDPRLLHAPGKILKMENNATFSGNAREVHDQYLVVDDDNKKSGEPPDPQSHCLLIEQASELNHGSLLDDYSMLAESTPAEESQGVHGLEVALNVTPVKNDDPGCNLNCSNVLITQGPGAIQDGGANVHDIVEKPQAKCGTLQVPPVENHKYYIDAQFRADLPLAKAKIIRLRKLKLKFLQTNLSKETQRIKMNGDILFGERRSLGEFHIGDLGSTMDVSLKNQGSAGSVLKSCHTVSLFKYAKQANELAATVDKMTNELCVEDAKVESLEENLFEGSSNSRLSNSAKDSHFLKVVADDGQSGRLPEPQTPSLVVDHGFEENHGLYLNDHLLLGKSTSSEELQEEKVLANVQVAKDQSDVDRSELKSSIVVIQVPLSMQDSGVDVEGMAEHELVEDAPSGSVDSETSNEYDKSSIDTLGTDMVFCGQASSESDSVLMTRDNQTLMSNTGNRFCMSEESVFLVQKETQANETNIVDIGVDKMNTIMPDDI
ncbi:hypothetical protein Acr_26g0011630 [Actinidia rufa]|uniref:Uncharacterized protein n=1 Tax=Actinidia rufa TaxID=165716 RepID=A0A7J0H554_9ERIC|nr:hypothetical protein Acr_26g0011630 [Actinidia rufa]